MVKEVSELQRCPKTLNLSVLYGKTAGPSASLIAVGCGKMKSRGSSFKKTMVSSVLHTGFIFGSLWPSSIFVFLSDWLLMSVDDQFGG